TSDAGTQDFCWTFHNVERSTITSYTNEKSLPPMEAEDIQGAEEREEHCLVLEADNRLPQARLNHRAHQPGLVQWNSDAGTLSTLAGPFITSKDLPLPPIPMPPIEAEDIQGFATSRPQPSIASYTNEEPMPPMEAEDIQGFATSRPQP
ncbi:MAG: hypothetical protein Q9180_006945, partial [Flavoplaca navasiana]